MLVVDVRVRVPLERVRDFLAAGVYRDDEAAGAHKLTAHYAAGRDTVAEMMAGPRESAKFAAVFPPGDEGWKGGSR